MTSTPTEASDLAPCPIPASEWKRILRAFLAIVPPESLVSDPVRLKAFQNDGYTIARQLPRLVVMPDQESQVSKILRLCAMEGLPVVARGAGTSLSGGAVPVAGGVVLSMAKFNRIKAIDLENRLAVVEPGVPNLDISRAVEDDGLFYAPDPSSQSVCTIGGNVAENAGGIHCLKYGLTTNNIASIHCVLMDGTQLWLGGDQMDSGGLDLMSVMTGSEGLLAVITEITVRLMPKPEAVGTIMIGFDSGEAAGEAVAAIIGHGLIPAAIEMMDKVSINAVDAFVGAGYPTDVDALLIVEVDGMQSDVDAALASIQRITRDQGAVHIQVAQDEADRERIWSGRKAAFPAIGRIASDYICVDGSIPRRAIGPMLKTIERLADQAGLSVANVFHAGDGNLHPLIMFDSSKAGDTERAEELGRAILLACVEVGGVLSGEHGIGLEKRSLMGSVFSDADLALQRRVKCAFDGLNLLNPGKVFPTLHRCADHGWMKVAAGRLPFSDVPRF